MGRDFISLNQLNREKIDGLFYAIKHIFKNYMSNDLKFGTQMLMGSIFLEPSTRTRLSFEAAMRRLGGDVITIESPESTSQRKGESIRDTIKTISQYVDVLVLRHPQKGTAETVSSSSDVPVINAGDGDGEHPTQGLIDLFTIFNKTKTLDGLKILFFGDKEYARTIKSLAQLLNLYDTEIDYEVPYCKGYDELKKFDVDSWHEKLRWADVIYVTRNQQERWADSFVIPKNICISEQELNLMKKDAIILHPLPRNNEIDPRIDSDKRQVCWDQVKNGIYVRMALLKIMLEPDELFKFDLI